MDKKAITGIVLAGGKSSRMGFDKGLAKTGNHTMIEQAVAVLTPFVNEVIIIANTSSYDYIGLPVYGDIEKGKGPLGGIYSGLYYSNTPHNIILACDMPLVQSKVIQSLIEHIGDNLSVTPALDKQLEPLCAYYNKKVLDTVKQCLNEDMLAVHKMIALIKNHTIIPFKNHRYFQNINSKEDLKNIVNEC